MRLDLDLDGPRPTWPGPVDAALEWWAGLTGRARVALRAAGAVVVIAMATGGLVEGRWGPPRPVLVAAVDITAGMPVPPTSVTVAERPRDVLPDDVLTDLGELPDDAVADGHIPAGSTITARAVRGGGVGGGAAPGTAVVPVPAEVLPPLPVGTRVDLAVASHDGGGGIVARDAVLVADDGTWRWLQVERTAVDAVARGVRDATLVAAVLPPPPGAGP